MQGSIIGIIKGDTRSLDYGPYELRTKFGFGETYRYGETCSGMYSLCSPEVLIPSPEY